MILRPLPVTAGLLLLCSLGNIRAQTRDKNAAYSDPDEIRVETPETISQAARKVFIPSQQAELCRRGKGFISFDCRVAGTGRITAITNVKLYQAAEGLQPSSITKRRGSILKNVVFHVLSALRPVRMSRFRQSGVVIPLKLFCR